MWIKATSANTGEPIYLNLENAKSMERVFIKRRGIDYPVTRIKLSAEYWQDVVQPPEEFVIWDPLYNPHKNKKDGTY